MKTTRIRVMIVEAHPAHAEAIREALKGSGTVWDIQVAGSLKEYYEVIASKPPDIVLMGMDLPDGRAMDALTAPPENAPFPILVITSRGDGKTAVQAMKSGALDYIVESPEAFAETPRKVVRALREWNLLKKAQQKDEQLRQSEERYRTITENMSETVWVMDLDFKTTYISPSVLRTRGFTLEELQALPLDRHMTPESFKLASQVLAEEMTPKKLAKKDLVISRQLDLEFYRKDGTTFWGDVVMTLVRDSEGKPREIIGIGRDITEKRKFEGALKKAAEEWRATFDSITDLISIQDADYRIVRVSKSLADFLKMKPKDLIGKHCYEVIHGTKQPPSFCPHKRVFETKKSIEEEIFEPRYGMYMHLVDSPIMDEKGDVVGSVHILKDITERKRVEKALKESEERYRSILHTMEDGYFEVDLKGSFTAFNESMRKMLEYDREEMVGLNYREYMGKEDTEKVFTAFNEVFLTGIPAKTSDWRLIKKDGKTIDIETSISLKRNNSGEPTGFFGVSRDITDRRRAEESLRESDIRFKKLSSNVPGMIYQFLKRPDGTYCVPFTTEAIKDIFGCSPQDVREDFSPITKVILPEDLDNVVDSIDASAERMTTWQCEYRVQIPGQPLKWLFGQSTPEKLADGSIIWHGFNTDITERKRAEEAVRESERDLKKTQQIAHLGSWRLDIETNQVAWTEELYKMYGFDPTLAPPPYTEHMKLFTPESWERLSTSLANTRETGIPYELELETVRKDGSYGWMWVRGEAIRDSKGNINGLWGAAQDITDRKRAEEALRESETRLSMAQRIAGTGSWDWDLTTKQQVWSAETFRIFGRDVNEYTPNVDDVLSSVHPDDREPLERKIRTSIEHDQPYEHEYRIVDPAGDIKYLHAVGEIVSDEQGKPIRLRGAVEDVTQRKRAEEALRESEERFKQVAESAGEWIWEVNADGLYTYASPIVEKILGYKPEEIVGRKYFYDFFHPEDIETFKAAALAAFAAKQPLKEFINCNVHKSGKTIWLSTSGSPMFDDKGTLIGYRGADTDITERKRAEEALKESEERYRELVENIEDIVYVTDGTGRIIFLNNAFTRISGYTREEMLQQNYMELLTPESLKDVLVLFKKQKKGQDAGVFEMSFINKDRMVKTIEVREKHILKGERVVEVHGLGRDVTDRKRAEEALRESEEKFRISSTSASDLIWDWNISEGTLDWFGSIDEMLGYGPGEFPRTLEAWEKVIHPEDRERVTAALEQYLKMKISYDEEYRVVCKDGELRYWMDRGSAIWDEKGNAYRMVGACSDITQRKVAENNMREINKLLFERTAELSQSEDKFRSLFQTSRDFMCITDLEGRFIDSNDAAREFFGYSSEELSQVTMLDLYPNPEDRQMIIKGILESGYVTNLETKLKKNSGEIVDVTVSVNLRRDKHGNPVQFFASARDMTEKRMLEQQLLQSEKLSAVGTMISGVAHELNNPLTSIIGNAQLLAKRDVPEDIKSKLSVILKESIRSSKIVAGLLAFAREHKPERKMIDIGDILIESVKLREYDVKVSNIDMRVSLSENIPKIYADPYQLQQVFINFINNARDALTGQESAALSIRTYRKDDAVLIEFEDNGPGISDAIAKKIFDPFFTTKEVGKGTGLGLSVAYGIVKEHDGMISVESEPTKGAKFTVTLPIRDGIQPAAEKAKTAVKPPPGTRTVLVVEDEASLRDLLTEALTDDGFFVESASTGDEAISLVEERKYDAIISDIKMPGIGGKELYLYIQKNHPEIADKIIFITGDILSKDTQSFLQITNNRFIEKPFDIDALVALLNDVLAG